MRPKGFMSHPTHCARVPDRVPSRGRLEQAVVSMKNMSTPLYQHVRSDSVPPRIKTLAVGWQVWDFAQEGSGDKIHIDYDGDYGSERVLIVSGHATVIPDDGTPSFNVGPGDAVYFMRGFRCTWHIRETPLRPRAADFKRSKSQSLTRVHTTARRGFQVRPRRGAALVFWSVRPDGAPDPTIWHAGCLPRASTRGRWVMQKFKSATAADFLLVVRTCCGTSRSTATTRELGREHGPSSSSSTGVGVGLI